MLQGEGVSPSVSLTVVMFSVYIHLQDLFKKFAKKMAEQVMKYSDSGKAELDREIKKMLQKYFTQFGQVSTEEDLNHLEPH